MSPRIPRTFRRRAAAGGVAAIVALSTTGGIAAASPDRHDHHRDDHDGRRQPPRPGTGPGRNRDDTASEAADDVTEVGDGLAVVDGIVVSVSIADELAALLAAAAADGINLDGWGYRTTEQQIELRKTNCGTSSYAIWEMPASACTPATAVPGTSRHEDGRAVDFTVAGAAITSKSDPAFLWLTEHAAEYGFFNLDGEPWHWSVDGR